MSGRRPRSAALGPAGTSSPTIVALESPAARRPPSAPSRRPLDPERIPLMKTAARPPLLGLLLSLFSAATARAQHNQPPVAQDDHYTVHGAAVIGSVLDNDYDPDGTVLNPSVLSLPSHGTLAGSPPASYLSTPQTGFTGTDAFSYQVCDNQNACATASVFISVVNARPFGVSDAYVVRGYTLLGHLLANDFDADNDTLSLGGIVRFPEHGTLYGVADPDLKAYLPANGYVGMDSFTYNVCDPYGACTETPVTLYVFEDGGQGGGQRRRREHGRAADRPRRLPHAQAHLQQRPRRAGRIIRQGLVFAVGRVGHGLPEPPLPAEPARRQGRLLRRSGRHVHARPERLPRHPLSGRGRHLHAGALVGRDAPLQRRRQAPLGRRPEQQSDRPDV